MLVPSGSVYVRVKPWAVSEATVVGDDYPMGSTVWMLTTSY